MDDHGDDFAGASLLSDSNVSLNGMVERSENPDYFTYNYQVINLPFLKVPVYISPTGVVSLPLP